VGPAERLTRKREAMRRVRSDPERRAKLNEYRRGRYKDQHRAYRGGLRDGHFFRWRAINWAGRVTAWELMCLWRSQRGRCAISGRPLGRDAHLDHIVPKTRGGSDGIENLRWLDPWVNIARQNLTDEEFAARCAQVVEATDGGLVTPPSLRETFGLDDPA